MQPSCVILTYMNVKSTPRKTASLDDKRAIKHLKNCQCRLTVARIAIVSIFAHHENPLSGPQILTSLSDMGIKVNKTTVYRELDFLVKNKIIRELTLKQPIKHYELIRGQKHHHALCAICGQIAKVSYLPKKDNSLLTRAVRETNFQIEKFSITFFGICPNCKNNLK